eukprot:1548719-Amphidinium_carterae.1
METRLPLSPFVTNTGPCRTCRQQLDWLAYACTKLQLVANNPGGFLGANCTVLECHFESLAGQPLCTAAAC